MRIFASSSNSPLRVTTSDTPIRQLSLPKVLLGALLCAWTLRGSILRQAGLAMAAQVLVILIWTLVERQVPTFVLWGMYLFNLAFTAIIAVRCHRLVLVPSESAKGIAMPLLEMRELKFLLAMFLIWITAWGAMLLPNIGLQMVKQSWPELPSGLVYWLAWVPGSYVAGRLTLKLPAAAIDRPMDVSSAILATRGNGWKMAVIIGLIPLLLGEIADLLFIADAGPAPMLISSIAMQLFIAVEVMALSIAYNELVVEDGSAAQ